jgi:hypothetical protein
MTNGKVRRSSIVDFLRDFRVATHPTTLGLVRRCEIVYFLRDSRWRRTLRLMTANYFWAICQPIARPETATEEIAAA